jgi:hypothetical protein
MRKTLTFAHVKGIPLKLHINWFLIMGVVTWSLSAVYFPFRYPDWHPIHTLVDWNSRIFTILCFCTRA